MNKPELKVTSIRTMQGRDGAAFECNLSVNGKRSAFVQYDGWGGGYVFRWDPKRTTERCAFEDHVKTTIPVQEPVEGREPLSAACLLGIYQDGVVGALVDDTLAERKLKRACKTRTCFREPGGDPDTYEFYRHPYDARMREHMAKKHPNAEILNLRFL